MPNVDPLEHSELAEFEQTFQLVEQFRGFVPRSMFTMGRRPDILRAFASLSAAVLVGGTVDRSLKQLIALVASVASGKRIMKQETIDFATKVRTDGRHRDVFDNPVNRALSVIVAGDDGNANIRGMGRVASPRTFGHGGAGGQIGWGDPETGISLGYCTNGFTDWTTIGRRVTAVSSLAAGCAQ